MTSESEPSGESEPEPSGVLSEVRSLLWEQIALLLTLAFFCLVGFRLFLVARGDQTTFRALLQYADPVPLALSVIPSAIFLAGVAILTVSIDGRWTGRPVVPWHWSLGLVVYVLLGGFVTGVVALVVTAFLVAAMGKVVNMLKSALDPDTGDTSESGDSDPGDPELGLASKVGLVIGAVVAVGLLLSLVMDLLGEPWLPAERIDHGETTVAFVLDETDDELVVLREKDRAVVRIRADEVEDRSICELEERDRPMFMLLLSLQSGPGYPSC